MAKKPVTKKPKKGQDPSTGKFQSGNQLGGNNGWRKSQQAREIFARHDFDPIESRIAYHNELVHEAQTIKDDLIAGIYTDMTGHRHNVVAVDHDSGVDIIDFKKVQFAQNRYDKVRQLADTIASQLTDYVHPKLRAIETSSGGATTWAQLMLAMEDTKQAAE